MHGCSSEALSVALRVAHLYAILIYINFYNEKKLRDRVIKDEMILEGH